MTTARPPESRSADSTAVSDEGQAPPLVHEMAPGQRFPSPNQVAMERGPFWRAGLLPESPWEAHPVTIIANLGEPIGESRIRHRNQLAVNHQRHPGHPRHRHRRVHPPPRHGILTRSAGGGPIRLLERVRHRQNQKGDSQGSQKVIQAMSWVKGGQPWMTRPYSEDLRERVVRVVESGTSRNAAAKQFDVSISFVVKLMQRWKQRGTIKADKYGGWKKSKLAPHGDRIRALVMENCDITIDELCVLLAAEGIEAKRSTLGGFLLAQGLSRKKRQPTPPSRSALTSRRREPLGATSNLG